MISIKTKEDIEKMEIAGSINADCRKYIETLVKPGITTKELNDKADEFIRSHGGIPSFLNYEGYPGSICISINDEVVHGIASSSRKIKNGDIVSVDVGVIYEGFHSDAANTYIVGNVPASVRDLVTYTENALYAGINKVKAGVKIKDISKAIENVAKKNNLGVVRELIGHGVGRELHEGPDVPNYVTNETDVILEAGMTIAIEPMFTLGKRHVWLMDDEWTIVTQDGLPSAHFEHTVLVTDNGYKILTGDK